MMQMLTAATCVITSAVAILHTLFGRVGRTTNDAIFAHIRLKENLFVPTCIKDLPVRLLIVSLNQMEPESLEAMRQRKNKCTFHTTALANFPLRQAYDYWQDQPGNYFVFLLFFLP